jgi:hypothetical protein
MGHEAYVRERLDGLSTPADDSAGTDQDGRDGTGADGNAGAPGRGGAADGTRTGRDEGSDCAGAAGAVGLAAGAPVVVAWFWRGTAYLYAVGGVAPAAALAIGPIVAAPGGVVLAGGTVIPVTTVTLPLVDVGRESASGSEPWSVLSEGACEGSRLTKPLRRAPVSQVFVRRARCSEPRAPSASLTFVNKNAAIEPKDT